MMLEPNDERLLWKYVDGLTTTEENRYLQQRLKTDQQIRHHLRYLQMLDTHLLEERTVQLPEVLKIRILTRTENLTRTKMDQTPAFDKKGMIFFTSFNLVVFVFGILIYVYNSGWVASESQLSMLTDFYQIIATPMTRSLFALCTAVLGLLFLDHFLKTRSYGKITTPV